MALGLLLLTSSWASWAQAVQPALEYRSASQPEKVERLLPLTERDRLWMGRMLYGEVGTAGRKAYSLVLWTVAQRLWYLPAFRNVDSFTDFMRRFSQPINPGFLDPRGRLCQKFRRSCGPALIARRQRIQSMTWNELPEELRRAVDDFLAGRLENLAPQSIDFARSYGPNDCINKGTHVLLRDPPGPSRRGGPQHVYCKPREAHRAPRVRVVLL
jgi:hypothetical protein